MRSERVRLVQMEGVLAGVGCLEARYITHRFAPHFHETYSVGVITEGRARSRYRGAAEQAGAGTIYAFEPGEVHTGEPVDEAGYGISALHPTAASMEISGDGGLPRAPHFGRGFIRDPELAARMVHLCQLLTTDSDNEASHEAFMDVMGDLVTRHSSPKPAEAQADHRRIAIARDYLEAHYRTRIDLAALAGACDSSIYHLIRTFKKHVGVPPVAYVQIIRVRRACELLRAGVPISEVAYVVGYCDQSHLTRRFRRMLGVTPGEFARAAGRTVRSRGCRAA